MLMGFFFKKIDISISTLKFFLLHFNPFEIFTFNSNFFIFCNLTQHFIIYNFGPPFFLLVHTYVDFVLYRVLF
ncbi:hypothetical protein HanXRQr2_Chr11g0475671 [Helianthus annuus]|uniref:Uncharacterized protein n=1 Tax=Helianthus annuus TaxID=4232 RepID=A0A9K3HM58_HELAN|nr:hypothetical protein HanXRQr2_Chr11g0475671 [Helianthus annuus]KAJ0508012.1 hypothetical protein HanIR_Chr11g0512611 [Helianthus annuus]